MKCNEINLRELDEINVEQELDSVEAGSGTFEEIKQAIEDGKIGLLKDNEDTLIGISYNSGKTGVEDTLEGLKFEKRFAGHNVMAYVYKALTGEELETEETYYNDDYCGLPDELVLDVDEDLNGEVSKKSIANYLRDTYDHYLSGKETQFEYEYEDGDYEVQVTNINWGRKR